MLNKIRRAFTKWYIKRGWTSGWHFIYDEEGEHPTHPIDAKRYFVCPWWVRPLLIFFSPCVYAYETTGYLSYDAFREEMKSSIVDQVMSVRAKNNKKSDKIL